MICAVLSIGGHFALAEGLSKLPKHVDPPVKRIISLRVVSPPPLEPPPEPAAAPAEPAPKVVPHERPHAHAAPPTHVPPPPDAPPPTEHPAVTGVGPAAPIFGVTMASTSQAGAGPAMPIGNTGGAFAPAAEAHKGTKEPLPPVPVYEVTKMPEPLGRCDGKYTEEARGAALEGMVILDLIVSETGRVRDVQIVSGLGHGLNEAAVAAAKKCRFSPGEKNGTPVPVRVPGFKIRFVLQNDE
jgi:periplasmic protein TonB